MARLPDDEIQRRYEEALEQCQITDEEAAVRWPDWHDLTEKQQEAKRGRAEKAAARHMVVVDEDTGQRMLGGPQPGAGPKPKSRLGQYLAEEAQKRATDVRDALFSGLDKSEAAAVRVNTAVKIATLERDEADLQLREDELRRELEDKPRDEIQRMLSEGLAKALISGELSLDAILKGLPGAHQQQVIEAEARDIVE